MFSRRVARNLLSLAGPCIKGISTLLVSEFSSCLPRLTLSIDASYYNFFLTLVFGLIVIAMFFALGNLLAAAALFKALPVKAAPYPFVLEERTGSGGCNADNLLRLLRTPSNLPEALPFCSSYLGLPASTTTVSTVTPTVTSYTTAVTIETALFTENPVVSLTLTATETSVIVATTTITVGVQAPYERLARHCTSTTSRASTTKSTTSLKRLPEQLMSHPAFPVHALA